MFRMRYPNKDEVRSLIEDYQHDFGVKLPFEEARRMLVLYEELHEIFERYGGDEGGCETPRIPSSVR